MQLYWTSVFILPASVLHAINKAMLQFLWDGHGSRKMVCISWKDICRTRDEGGLGICSPNDYNHAGILRLLWEIETNRDALWVKWLCRKYLRGSSIWCARPPQSASWAWRGILQIRYLAVELLRYQVGNGQSTNFFLDPWLGYPPILLQVGDQLRRDMGCNLLCKVSTFMEGR